MNKKVLIITYFFPPRSAIASLRLRGLAKYLPEFDWDPVILTAQLPGEPDPQFHVVQTPYPGDASATVKKRFGLNSDKGLQEQMGIPLSMREGKRSATRSIVSVIKGVVAYPDEQKNWYPFAVKAGSDLLSKDKCDALLSSASPVTTHVIASELKAKHGLPWVADFRDLWTQNPYYPFLRFRKFFEKSLEIKTMASADALVSTSSPWAKTLNDLHRKKPVFAIPNGFDPEAVNTGSSLTPRFTITYTGALYQGKRDPELLFKGLSELISRELIDPADVSVRFYGPIQYWLDQDIKKYGLEDVVTQNGNVPRDVSIAKQRESQVLLLLSWDDPRERGTYTGKVFEYMAGRRPILGVGGPEGVVSELLRETQAGVHTSDLTTLKDTLTRYYQEFKKTGQVRFQGIDDKLQKYSHREMARRFARVLNDVVTSVNIVF